MIMEFDALSNRVIGCAIEVHRVLGPGLLESAYEQCLAKELSDHRIPFALQVPVTIQYKELRVDIAYRLDLLVDGKLIVEIKSSERLIAIHHAQLLTYMKLARVSAGLLINFNSLVLKDGIKRFVL